ncbi:MAG: hypothetical protein OEY14_07085 [Myxococcales bacterium]|nr:hypothetical protein [Myxococcales bacterium]
MLPSPSRPLLSLLIGLVLCLLMPAQIEAQPPPIEGPSLDPGTAARLEALERAVEERGETIEELREELEELREDTEDAVSDVQDGQADADDQADAIWQELARRMTFFGYSTHFLRFQPEKDPYFRAFRVNIMFNAQVARRLRFFAELEFEDPFVIGKPDGGFVEGEQGFIELTLAPALALRAGMMLVPVTSFNLRHEGWRQPFVTRPLMNDRIFPSTYADVGVALFGTLYSGEDVQLGYQLMASNGLRTGMMSAYEETDGSMRISGKGLRSARPDFQSDNNSGKSLAARLSLMAGEHLDFAMSGYWGPYRDDSSDSLYMAGADLTLSFDALRARIEGIYIGLESGTHPFTRDDGSVTDRIYPRNLIGGVAEVELRFFPSALRETPLGEFDDPRFFVAFRADYGRIHFRPLASHPATTQTELRASASIGYRPVQRSAIRLEYMQGFGDPDTKISLGDSWEAHLSFALGY